VVDIAFSPQCEQSKPKQSQDCREAPIERFFVGIGSLVHAYSTDLAAISTVVIAIFTVTLWRATSGQLREVQKSLKLARDEFNATHRPKIAIISLEQPESAANDPKATVAAVIRIANEGISKATNVSIYGLIKIDEFDPDPGLDLTLLEARNEILSGASTFNVGSALNCSECASRSVISEPFSGTIPEFPYCIGRIDYSDATGAARQTGFCWKWEAYVWVHVQTSSYDYSY
jgi:hypothetical protein